MAEDTSTTSPEKNWLTEMSWKTMLIYAALSIVTGGVTSVGVASSKVVAAQGLNQDQADVRYITKEEANRRSDVRDRQFEEIKRSMVTSPVFDERTNMILKQIELLRQEQKEDRAAMERMIISR